MASDAQIDANRRNAMKSTGPRTETGKSVSRRNAIKHGLTATRVVHPDEDAEELDALREELEQELNPVGRQETDRVEQIAMLMFRKYRPYRLEAEFIAYQQAERELELAQIDEEEEGTTLDRCLELADRKRHNQQSSNSDEQVPRSGSGQCEFEPEFETDVRLIEAENRYNAAKERLIKAEKEFERWSGTLGAILFRGRKYTEVLEFMLRYEVVIDRALARAQDELRRLQRDREDRAAVQATLIEESDAAKEAST